MTEAKPKPNTMKITICLLCAAAGGFLCALENFLAISFARKGGPELLVPGIVLGALCGLLVGLLIFPFAARVRKKIEMSEAWEAPAARAYILAVLIAAFAGACVAALNAALLRLIFELSYPQEDSGAVDVMGIIADVAPAYGSIGASVGAMLGGLFCGAFIAYLRTHNGENLKFQLSLIAGGMLGGMVSFFLAQSVLLPLAIIFSLLSE